MTLYLCNRSSNRTKRHHRPLWGESKIECQTDVRQITFSRTNNFITNNLYFIRKPNISLYDWKAAARFTIANYSRILEFSMSDILSDEYLICQTATNVHETVTVDKLSPYVRRALHWSYELRSRVFLQTSLVLPSTDIISAVWNRGMSDFWWF